MSERLTKKISKTIQDKYSLGSYLYYDFAGLDDTNKLLNKLGKLEDLLEKYGIESVEELDKILSWLYTLSGQDAEDMKFIAQERKQIHDMYCEIKKDRDTWQKACELACKYLEVTPFNEKNDKYVEYLVNYYYQKAKKEGDNDERN